MVYSIRLFLFVSFVVYGLRIGANSKQIVSKKCTMIKGNVDSLQLIKTVRVMLHVCIARCTAYAQNVGFFCCFFSAIQEDVFKNMYSLIFSFTCSKILHSTMDVNYMYILYVSGTLVHIFLFR